MKFGERLKLLRKNENWTQKVLANKINVQEYTIGDYERGRSEPDIETLKKLCIVFKLSMDELLEFNYDDEIQSSKINIKNTGTINNSFNNNKY